MTNEKRLIDDFRHEIMSEFIEQCQGNDFNRLTLLEIGETIDRIYGKYSALPTVDAVEVVHGKWIVTDADSGEPGSYAAYIEVNCSKCGYSLGAESGQYGWYLGDPFPLRYCPNCGAKMDGGTSP